VEVRKIRISRDVVMPVALVALAVQTRRLACPRHGANPLDPPRTTVGGAGPNIAVVPGQQKALAQEGRPTADATPGG
jgi:hypothetical protein